MSEYKLNYDNDTGIDDDGFWEWWEIERDEHVICKCNEKYDADEILRILNAHDDLVVALKEIRDMCNRQRDFNDDGDGKCLNRVDAALSKAEGK